MQFNFLVLINDIVSLNLMATSSFQVSFSCYVPFQARVILRNIIDSGFQVSMMEKDFYLGRILTGRVCCGIVRVGDKIHGLRTTGSGVEKIEEGKVCISVA